VLIGILCYANELNDKGQGHCGNYEGSIGGLCAVIMRDCLLLSYHGPWCYIFYTVWYDMRRFEVYL